MLHRFLVFVAILTFLSGMAFYQNFNYNKTIKSTLQEAARRDMASVVTDLLNKAQDNLIKSGRHRGYTYLMWYSPDCDLASYFAHIRNVKEKIESGELSGQTRKLMLDSILSREPKLIGIVPYQHWFYVISILGVAYLLGGFIRICPRCRRIK